MLRELCETLFGKGPLGIRRLGQGNNDCWSYQVRIAGQRLKFFECGSAERARGVAAAAGALERARVPIPHVVAVADHVVVAEWIAGQSGEMRAFRDEAIAAYQARLHAAAVGEGKRAAPCGFLHLDWLCNRLRAAGSRHLHPADVEEACVRLRSLTPSGLATSVVHPDFIAPNLVLKRTGSLVVVDNEFLSVAAGFEFDVLNSAYFASPDEADGRERYLEAYSRHGGIGTLGSHRAFWELCHLLKRTGKRFALGDVPGGLDSYERLRAELTDLESGATG